MHAIKLSRPRSRIEITFSIRCDTPRYSSSVLNNAFSRFDAGRSASRVSDSIISTWQSCSGIILMRRDPLVAMVPATSPIAKKRKLTYAEFVKEPVIFREAQSVTQQLLEIELVRQSLQVEPVMYVDGREALEEAIAQGMGVGVIASAEFNESRRIRMIPLQDCQVEMIESLTRLAERPASNLLNALFATSLD